VVAVVGVDSCHAEAVLQAANTGFRSGKKKTGVMQ